MRLLRVLYLFNLISTAFCFSFYQSLLPLSLSLSQDIFEFKFARMPEEPPPPPPKKSSIKMKTGGIHILYVYSTNAIRIKPTTCGVHVMSTHAY